MPKTSPVQTLATVFYEVGCYGSFLRMLCEKFSKHCPDIEHSDISERGTVHELTFKNKWSGFFQKFHFSDSEVEKLNPGLCMCIIPTSQTGYLLYKKNFVMRRPNKKDIGFDDLEREQKNNIDEVLHDLYDQIHRAYNIPSNYPLSRFLIRNFFKTEWLSDIESRFDKKMFENYIQELNLKKFTIVTFELENFLNFESFFSKIKKINDDFGLGMDFDRVTEIESIFDNHLSKDPTRLTTSRTLDIIQDIIDGVESPIEKLSVIDESYVLADLEKKFEGIDFSLLDRFPDNTKYFIDATKYFRLRSNNQYEISK